VTDSSTGTDLDTGATWPGCYRGYRLQTNADGDVWWQPYQSTERLYLEPTPEKLVDRLLSVDRLGGRVRVTEGNAVLTRVEVNGEYEERYVTDVELDGDLVPREAPEYAVPLQPGDLSPGDLWPSVYDGAKFSFAGDRVWWQSGDDHRRYPVESTLPQSVWNTLRRLKPRGGSFRVTPWNEVLTLVSEPPDPERARKQLRELPRVVENVIKLRRERGVEMLPVYVGELPETPLEIGERRSLTDPLSESEREELDSWASSLGATTETDRSRQRVDDADQSEADGDGPDDNGHGDEIGGSSDDDSEDGLGFDDDPETW
jgi:hypothetical protein